ncbi:MAG: 3-hydroxyacyl-ACP dehydratase FabZ [Gemmatimonadaceae bacterium]
MSDNPDQRIEIDALLRSLPHRYPFLLVDRIIEMERDVRITGVKNVTMDEPFFAAGSGSGEAAMPGLLIIEALAQTGAVLLMTSQAAQEQDAESTKLVYFASLHNAVFHGVVRPGDQLRLEITVTQARGRLRKVHGAALVDGTVVCEGDLAAVLVDRTV